MSLKRSFEALPDPTQPFSGRVFRYGDNINTDVIFPGKYTYTLTTPEEVAPHALEDLDPTFVERVATGDVLVAGNNFGCGSSREQAVTCLRAVGIGAVVARSFSRIFYRNALNQGLLALVCPEAVDGLADSGAKEGGLQEGERIEVDLGASQLRSCQDQDRSFSFAPLSDSTLAMLEAGGLIPMVKKRLAAERERS